MTVSRETFGPDHFFDIQKTWFSQLFKEVEYPWDLLAPKKKEAWIQAIIRPNISDVPREGALVLKTTRIKAGEGVAEVQAGSYLVGEGIELKRGVTGNKTTSNKSM